MAYCWGMYVNGIAVYGRDPLLTCDYVRFLAEDQNCPGMGIDREIIVDGGDMESKYGMGGLASLVIHLLLNGTASNGNNDLQPTDWKNCSSSGYHP